MRRLFIVAAGGVIAVVIAAIGARAVLASPPTSQLLTFRDHLDPNLVLTIEADPAASDAGMFSMRVPARGIYLSRVGAQLRVASPTSTIAQYAGDADLIVNSAGHLSRSVMAVTLQAELDPSHHTAQATLTVGSDRFHLVQPAAGKGGIETALRAFETALAANDWRSIYALTTVDITGNLGADAFVTQATAQQSSVGTTTGLQRQSVGDIHTNPAGMSFVVATYAITQLRPGGSSVTSTYDAYFVLQGDNWKLWFTARH